MTDNKFQIHLVSDSTGNTLNTIAQACLSQFDDVQVELHAWPLTTSCEQIDSIVDLVKKNPGLVLYTMVEPEMAARLEELCDENNIKTFNILMAPIKILESFFNAEFKAHPGEKHKHDIVSISRLVAMEYALKFEEGKADMRELEKADLVLVGPSRTSKTPTCVYLANKGIKAANITIFTDKPLPDELFKLKDKLIVGLTAKPERLVELRRNRLKIFDTFIQTDYLDQNAVEDEIAAARKIYTDNAWPILDVTNRSIEDVCDDIITLIRKHQNAR